MFQDVFTGGKVPVGLAYYLNKFDFNTTESKDRILLKILDKHSRNNITIGIYLGNGFPLVSSISQKLF